MQFGEEAKPYSYEVQREGGEDVIYVNYLGIPYVPSISESPEVMERTVDVLIENPNISRIVFVQQKNYNYDFQETSYLLEIAQLYVYLLKQERILSRDKLITNHEEFFNQRYNDVLSFISFLKRDPIAAYFDLRRMIIEATIFIEKIGMNYRVDQKNYVLLLEKIFNLLEKTKIIQAALPHVQDYRIGDREIYHKLFKPDVIPNFTFTRLVLDLPENAEIISQYKIASET
ncbi:MAG: hypothetical protein Q8P15_04115, partial [Nanoarchaeota archaeon]|nr:hypothetical protein [Nanoarchaeota archaeon]